MTIPSPARGFVPIPAQSWFYLFFDLAFVASIVVVSNTYSQDYSAGQVAWLILVFTLIWTTWLFTTLRMQSAEVDRMWPRFLIIVQMGAVLLMAITANEFVEDVSESVGALFAVILAASLLLNRALSTPADPTRLNRGETLRVVAAVVLFAATWFTAGEPILYAIQWLVGLGLVLSTLRSRVAWDSETRRALGHRFGEFTIIVLGESFLKIGLVASEEPLEEVDLLALPLIFGVIAALWWLYFAHVAPMGVPEHRPRTWMLTHLPLHMFLVALAVGLSKLLLPSANSYFGSGYALITVPLVVALCCLGVLIRLGGGPYARRGLIAMLVCSAAVLGVVALNYLGRGLEFDLAGTVLLILIVLAAGIRALGPHAEPDRVTTTGSDRASAPLR